MTAIWAPIDAYCERTSANLVAEPINAVTNLAFIVAAWIMWRRSAGLPIARALCGVLAVIGVASGLFHSFANGATAAFDVAAILVFVLLYLFAAARDFLWLAGWRPWAITAAFLPYAAVTVPLFASLEFLGASAAYAPIPVLILGVAALLWTRAGNTARGLVLGAAILVISLAFRTLDPVLCAAIPNGTHFVWHLLNAAMLGWMIEVYRRHMLAGQGPRR